MWQHSHACICLLPPQQYHQQVSARCALARCTSCCGLCLPSRQPTRHLVLAVERIQAACTCVCCRQSSMPGMRRTTSSTAAATAALAARLAAVETQLAGLQQAQAATDASVAAAGAGSARPPSAFTPVRPGRRSTLDLQGVCPACAGPGWCVLGLCSPTVLLPGCSIL